ncbi:hypothetical protein RvY_03077 [Ramazzottius varieornatus]|uniref:Uncharacterized protein n=1 Tax=Ramazzottius varieornatus TaxID=947166 RepID=A0A1D1UTW9_RAMVA|nr:hypothetical protein RvY_03077 [Ramazzottius varieornatus]
MDRQTIRRFVSWLDSEGLSGKTATVYVAGVRSEQLEHGFEDPGRNDHYLSMTLKGLTNQTRPDTYKRKPLTIEHLRQLKADLFGSLIPRHDQLMLWSAFTMAFYGMLRVSEYTRAASTASKAGCSMEQIRAMGRWSSDVSNRYVRPDMVSLTQAMLRISG